MAHPEADQRARGPLGENRGLGKHARHSRQRGAGLVTEGGAGRRRGEADGATRKVRAFSHIPIEPVWEQSIEPVWAIEEPPPIVLVH
jgi:hypothetical protein